jgi:hypothetical protein
MTPFVYGSHTFHAFTTTIPVQCLESKPPAVKRILPKALLPSSATPGLIRDGLGDDFDFGRPHRPESIPLALLHDVFGQFMEDVQTCIPTTADNQFASKLCQMMIQVYQEESSRAAEFRTIWEEFIEAQLDASVISEYRTGAHYRIGRFHAVITVGKRELHYMKADPLVQAAMYYLKSLEPLKSLNDRFPCLIVYYAGMNFK